MARVDPDDYRFSSREGWEQSAPGWGRLADRMQDWAMAVSVTMVDALALQPGDRVLELAAGAGDTGFMAAELIQPGGTLISSDGAEAMVAVARQRAAGQGLRNVEFRQLELEWIDMETASVDAVLCRWGIMLVMDPEAAAREIRRILTPRGRVALAVWDVAERNPWATIPHEALREVAALPAADPDAPGMFVLGAEGALAELLRAAGLIEVKVAPVALVRHFASVDEWMENTLEISSTLRATWEGFTDPQREDVRTRVAEAAAPFTDRDGSLELPASSLVASASA